MVSYQIVSLFGRQLAWKICIWLTRLLKHSPNEGIECIHPHHKRLIKNRNTKDWRTHKRGLVAVKCRLLNGRPVLNLTYPKKVRQGGSNVCKMVYILAIVVAQTKELLYIPDTSGRGPLINSHQLGPRGPSHGQLYGPGNWPCSEEMHISLSSDIAGECKSGSGWNRSGVSAPRGYGYTQWYC